MKITNVMAVNVHTKSEFTNAKKNEPTQKDADLDHVPVKGNIHTDSLSISRDAVALRRLNEQSSEADSPFEDFAKCLKIALRIMNGDRVPMKDEQFLAETEPEMYAKAIMLQRQNDDPQKFKSLLDDNKEETAPNDSPSVAIELHAQTIETAPD